jgi:hypothetical protein
MEVKGGVSRDRKIDLRAEAKVHAGQEDSQLRGRACGMKSFATAFHATTF